MSEFVGRIDQLDSIELDAELRNGIIKQLREAVKYLPQWILIKVLPELEVLAELSLYFLTFYVRKSTTGQKLLGLRVSDKLKSWKILTLIAIEVFPKYLITRLTSVSNSKQFQHLCTALTLAKFLNVMTFLQDGKYPTLARRLLGITLVRTDDFEGRDIGYSYLSRELLWHSLMEILVLAIPLLNLPKLKNMLQNWTNKSSKAKVDPNLCVSCLSHLVVASKSNCSHHFCYFCLASNLASDPQYKCPICKTTLQMENIQPLRGNQNNHLVL